MRHTFTMNVLDGVDELREELAAESLFFLSEATSFLDIFE
jgi:hypothetical protein